MTLQEFIDHNKEKINRFCTFYGERSGKSLCELCPYGSESDLACLVDEKRIEAEEEHEQTEER